MRLFRCFGHLIKNFDSEIVSKNVGKIFLGVIFQEEMKKNCCVKWHDNFFLSSFSRKNQKIAGQNGKIISVRAIFLRINGKSH